MNRTHLSVVLASTALALAATAPSAAHAEEDIEDIIERARKGEKNEVELHYTAQRKGDIDTDGAVKIGARTLEMSWGTLTLEGGYLVPVEPQEVDEADASRVDIPERDRIGAVYVGPGRFNWTPPNDTERWTMNFLLDDLGEKKSDRDEIDVAISDGVVLYFNGKWRDLLFEGGEKAQMDGKTAAAAKKLYKSRGDLWQKEAARMDTYDALQGVEQGFLVADVMTKDLKGVPALTYSIDPRTKEPVQLSVVKRYALNRDSLTSSSLGSWFTEEQAEGKTARELGYERQTSDYDVKHYDMDMTAYRDDDAGEWGMSIKGSVNVGFRKELSVLRLAMMNFGETGVERPVHVNRLTDAEGKKLAFLHSNHELLIKLPRAYKPGEEITLQFETDGLFIATIKQPEPSTSLMDSNAAGLGSIINYRVPNGWPWYPGPVEGFSDFYTFDWKLRVPKPMIAATSGTLLSMTEEGKYNVHTVKETTPVSFPAILFGRLSVQDNAAKVASGEHKYIVRIYLHPGHDKDAQSFIDDTHAAIMYYEQMFGPYPFQEMDLAQMPLGMGYAQAPAGLVQMTGETYISKTDLVNLYSADSNMLFIRDTFIPHEIAHEWWGHVAGLGNDRDQWVSETFAEYSASLFLEEREQQKAGDKESEKGYKGRKARWGKDGRMGHTFKRTGPVWVGNRVGPRRTSTIYARGPLILDMIRENFGKEAVIKMMYTWCEYARQNEGKIVTEDLQNILEKVVPGVGFEAFIDLYIKGNEPLPTDPKKDVAAKLGLSKY